MSRKVIDFPDGTRQCTSCGRVYPRTLEYFRGNGKCRDGISGWCIPCSNAYSKTWKEKNRERLAARRREIYAATEGKAVKDRERRRQELHPLRVRAQLLRAGMSQRAQKRCLNFDADLFTVDWLMRQLTAQKGCACCARVFNIVATHSDRPCDASPSVDRIDPAKGYVGGNVALLCWRCNNLKRDASIDELETVVAWMRQMRDGDSWGLGHEWEQPA